MFTELSAISSVFIVGKYQREKKILDGGWKKKIRQLHKNGVQRKLEGEKITS